MMSKDSSSWTPPVEFYFQVQFHLGGQPVAISFQEVSGLEKEISLQESGQFGGDAVRVKLPKEVMHSNIVLKRALEPMSEQLSKWIHKCLDFMTDGFISPCDMVISLMDSSGQPMASWLCTRAYPVKWSLGTLDSQRSGLAVETLTMTYNRLERKK